MSIEVTVAVVGGLFAVAAAIAGTWFERWNERTARQREAADADRIRLNSDITNYATTITTAIHKVEWLTWMAKNYADETVVRKEVERYQESMYMLWAEIDAALLNVAARRPDMHSDLKTHETRLRRLDVAVAETVKPFVIGSPETISAMTQLGYLHEKANDFWNEFGKAILGILEPAQGVRKTA